MQDRQDHEIGERKEPAAQQDKNSQRPHAAVPQKFDTGKQEADPLGSELARADKRQQGCRKGEGQACDGEDEGCIGPPARAARQNSAAAHATSLFSRLKADRTVFQTAQVTD
jgi:hypothetical protein